MKVALTVFAVAHAVASPSVGEDSVRHVLGHDLGVDCGHEFKVVGSEGACEPEVGIGCMLSLVSIFIDRQPVRMRVVDIAMARMGIGSCNHVHAKVAAALHEIPKSVHIAKPLASIMERNLCGIERHASASCKERCVCVNPLEVVQ